MSETWSEKMVRYALRMQDKVKDEISPELRGAGKNRKARLLIEDDNGSGSCEIFLKWDGEKVVEESDPKGVRNEFKLHSQTLLDLATGEIRAREALAARLVTVTGDKSFYDQEDLIQLFEKLQSVLVAYIQSRG